MVRFVRHSLYGLVAFLGVILAALAAAQATPSFPPTLVSVTGRAPVAGGLQVMATFRAMPSTGAANSAFFTVPATLTPSTVGGLARGIASRSGPAVAALGAVIAAGWVFDQLTQTFRIPQNPAVPLGPFSWNVILATPTEFYSSTPQGLIGACQQHGGASWCAASPLTRINDITYRVVMTRNGVNEGHVGRIERVATPPGAQPWSPPPVVATDAEIGQILIQQPSSWPTLLTNADGSPVRTPELGTAAQALATQLAQGTQPSPHTGWDTGFQGGEPLPSPSPSPSPSPTPNPQPVELTFPVFCEWASAVCEFIDWMREAAPTYETVPLPMEDLETLRVPWSSGLGGGSCPTVAPVVLRDGWEVSIPVTVMCDLATLLRPVLILLASLLAVFILVGGVRAP